MPDWFPLEQVVSALYGVLLPWVVPALLAGIAAGTILLVAGLPRR